MGRRTARILTLACVAALAPAAVPAGASQVSEAGSLLLIKGVKQVTLSATARDVAGLHPSARATAKIRAVKH